ncbi:DUF805 domain-containing protein [Paracoccus pacificus]|uniref:DUF805 domain-containing protein n=1 Tax=Paracoccus pacificus TaxID=1463598 RepID=A0ABW4R7K1_9RHOB
MNITSAITAGFAGTFRWKARATRAEYWLFLPVGLLLPALTMTAVTALGFGVGIAIVAGLAALLPLVAVTSRRALDTGATIAATLEPTLDLIGLIGWVWLTRMTGTSLYAALNAADGPAGFGTMWLFLITMPVMVLIGLSIFLRGLIRGAALFSQMAEPSQPGPNKYGPNPSEVQQ